MSMKTLEELLPANRFIRVHRSFIVQAEKIPMIERNRIVFGYFRKMLAAFDSSVEQRAEITEIIRAENYIDERKSRAKFLRRSLLLSHTPADRYNQAFFLLF